MHESSPLCCVKKASNTRKTGCSDSACSKILGDEVADGARVLRLLEEGDERDALAGRGVLHGHEGEADHGQTAVLDLTELHLIELLSAVLGSEGRAEPLGARAVHGRLRVPAQVTR